MSTLNHKRVYDIQNQRMYHFVVGITDGVYTVLNDLGEEVRLMESSVDVQDFICKYDNTTWSMLQHHEKLFWEKKGYSEYDWKGKEIYVGDICKIVESGIAEKAFVVKVEHQVCLVKPDETVKEIPYDSSKGKIYVIGNICENLLLLENDDLMVERRLMDDRRAMWRGNRDRRTSEDTILSQ